MQILAYKTYLTGTVKANEELPMIVILHFMGSNPDQFFDIILGSFDYPARVIAPYGPYRHDGQYAWFPDDLYNQGEDRQGKFIDETAKNLLDNIEIWGQEFPTKGKPICLGMSQGGDISFTLAAKYADRFNLCLPIAGRLLTDELVENKNAGMIRTHIGTKDPHVPLEGVRKAAKHLLSASLDVDIREYEGVEHTMPEEMVASIHDDIIAAMDE